VCRYSQSLPRSAGFGILSPPSTSDTEETNMSTWKLLWKTTYQSDVHANIMPLGHRSACNIRAGQFRPSVSITGKRPPTPIYYLKAPRSPSGYDLPSAQNLYSSSRQSSPAAPRTRGFSGPRLKFWGPWLCVPYSPHDSGKGLRRKHTLAQAIPRVRWKELMRVAEGLTGAQSPGVISRRRLGAWSSRQHSFRGSDRPPEQGSAIVTVVNWRFPLHSPCYGVVSASSHGRIQHLLVIINKCHGVAWVELHDSALENLPQIKGFSLAANVVELLVKGNVEEWSLGRDQCHYNVTKSTTVSAPRRERSGDTAILCRYCADVNLWL